MAAAITAAPVSSTASAAASPMCSAEALLWTLTRAVTVFYGCTMPFLCRPAVMCSETVYVIMLTWSLSLVCCCLCCSRRTEERRKRRQREMIDDDADRQKEQQELAELEAKQPIEPSHSEASADGIKQEIKQEPEEQSAAVDVDQQPQEQQQQEQKPLVDAKDEIYQAMLAAAAGSAPPSSAASPAHQTQQPVAAPPAIAGPRPTAVMGTSTLARKGRKLAVSALFDDEDEDNTKRRKLVPIKYTDEEMRAVEDHSAAVAAAVAGAAAAAAGQSGGQQQQNDGTVPVYPPGLDFGQRKTFLRQWMDTLPNSREALHA